MQVAQQAFQSYRRTFLVRGIIAILFGVLALVAMEIVAAFTLPLGTGREWLLGLSGVVSIIFGILIAIRPNTGLVALVWLLGIYAIVFGILYIVGYLQTRSLASSLS